MRDNSRDNPYQIGQLNRTISFVLENESNLNDIYVIGEASNVKYHTNGYVYFSLKDGKEAISSIVYKWDVPKLRYKMKDGDKVLIRGNIKYSSYNGSCQLQAMTIEPAGAGDLNAQFEELKRQLSEMGMFDAMYKKPIPKYVTNLGVVTSPTGAAVQDIIRVSRSRYPGIRIVVYPALVQGEGAAPTIVRGIEILDQMGLDAIIVGRGGGSKEDLWCFNDATVARAIFDADTPIISAVGHEIDTSISDFVADASAATPSAAAELAVFDAKELEYRLSAVRQDMRARLDRSIAILRMKLRNSEDGLRHLSPQGQLLTKVEHLADLQDRMSIAMHRKIKDVRIAADYKLKLTGAMQTKVALRTRDIGSLRDRFRYVSPDKIYQRRLERVRQLAGRLEALSPVKRLASGFSYVTDENGKNIKSTSDVEVGSLVTVYMNEGSIKAQVKEKYDGR